MIFIHTQHLSLMKAVGIQRLALQFQHWIEEDPQIKAIGIMKR